MGIQFIEKSKTFHLYNDSVSYIMEVLPNGHMGQLYFGGRIHLREDYSYLSETILRSMTAYVENDSQPLFTLANTKQEYGVYGTTDFRQPALEVLHENGSRLTDAKYESHQIMKGKPKLQGLPAVYTEDDSEAETLEITLKDSVCGLTLKLSYTIFRDRSCIARSVRLINEGSQNLHLLSAMSLCLDLPDSGYDMVHSSGCWGREFHLKTRHLEPGIQSVGSRRGNSSHEHNPFMVLKRPRTDEFQGEALGFSLIYSGNFLAQAEVDAQQVTRVLMGIHPGGFDWKLEPGAQFQTPEAVIVYSDSGLNKLSQEFHQLYGKRLARGTWRDRPSPILLNNWEATYFDFNEERLLKIAAKAKECGVELFVLDDGWFGARRSDNAGLGDWVVNRDVLPDGITGLAQRVEDMGMMFGLWIEPEMVNEDSDLYREHPDWIISTPGYPASKARHQWVLDYSRPEVVDHIHQMIAKLLREAKISYIKWDMNRSITECYSSELPADRQGEVFHRYILGVYSLYERLTSEFPHVLFESCASGGGRFDPGMLHYAPQCWTSDDSDAAERMKIQYGTSYCYPLRSIGAHVSAVPNHQLGRVTPLQTRADVACFGTFGYELDLNKLSAQEIEDVKKQIVFVKKYRNLLQYGTFYRLENPFEGNLTAWMVVSEDKKDAIVGWYRTLNMANAPFSRRRLKGLSPDFSYTLDGSRASHYGDELMQIGLLTSDTALDEFQRPEKGGDFDARLFILHSEDKQ